MPRRVINTGEDCTAQITCMVRSLPKPHITWEKEQTNSTGDWKALIIDVPNSRYNVSGPRSSPNVINGSVGSAGPSYVLTVKYVEGRQDFGRYRCRAENKIGVSYSDYIMLTGKRATISIIKCVQINY